MEIKEFTDSDIRRMASQLYHAADGLGTDEAEFDNVRAVLDILPEEQRSDVVNQIDQKIREFTGGEGLRDLIIGDFSSVEERDMLQGFGYPDDFGDESRAFANEVSGGSLKSDYSNFGAGGAFSQRNKRPGSSDPEFDGLFQSMGGQINQPGVTETLPTPPTEPTQAPQAPQPVETVPDPASEANQPPTNFNNPITTSAEPPSKFTNNLINKTELPPLSDPEARAEAINNVALDPELANQAATEARLQQERMALDFPTAEAPAPLTLDENGSLRATNAQIFRQRNLERDADAINFKSKKDLQKRDNILGSSDFDDFTQFLGSKGINDDPREMDFRTLKRLSDDYRYNRPRQNIPSRGQQTMGQRIDDRNATIQNPEDQFTGYAGPSTNNKLMMVSRKEAERLSAFDEPYTSVPLTEEQGRESFWDSGNYKKRENWF